MGWPRNFSTEEIDSNETARIVDEGNEIFESAVAHRERTANIAVDAKKRLVGSVGGFSRVFEPSDIGKGTDAAVVDTDAVDGYPCGGARKPFNVYMAAETVPKSGWAPSAAEPNLLAASLSGTAAMTGGIASTVAGSFPSTNSTSKRTEARPRDQIAAGGRDMKGIGHREASVDKLVPKPWTTIGFGNIE
uniref:Uncharacterized protein n=1 Tax=Mycena chlorophos TaxID=658473 RepID=A0ABQ0MAY5_MYCCL|nr:predicted protein [Mycena chlorophos]